MLKAEFENLNKSWFSIYNWPSLSRKGYSEEIAKLLLEKFEEIKVNYDSLRKNNFRLSSHHGQCQLSTDISQHVEKRFCRALFNLKEVPLLGTILDYEVPFKEKGYSKHGDIDLLSIKDDKLFIVEAKKFGSSESILKAILEAYVYSKLVNAIKDQLYADFKIEPKTKISPVVLIFKESASGKQLMDLIKYPYIGRLTEKINIDLMGEGIEKISFFLIANTEKEIEGCLVARPFDEKSKMIVFREDFNLKIKEVEIQ